MKHYGDITQLHGDKLEPVDLIVGGSPCQDLSIAGLRKGLEGERSGLFMDMIRLIKEMRNETNGLYPRFALWENVCGATSSNDGRDFSAVLTEFARVVEPDTPDVPVPEEGWPKSGILLGSDWSISWRTHDAQYWGKTIRDSRTGDVLQMGTPQRRRRIALIADFRGKSAYEILFERKSSKGNTKPGGETEQGSAGEVETGTDCAVAGCLNPWDIQLKRIQPEGGIADCFSAAEKRYGGGESYVLQEVDKPTNGANEGNDASALTSSADSFTENIGPTLMTIFGEDVVPTSNSKIAAGTGNTQDD